MLIVVLMCLFPHKEMFLLEQEQERWFIALRHYLGIFNINKDEEQNGGFCQMELIQA